ncbi:MAG: NAD-binding protein, partial [Proteobacteria bacterium]|nr:NAD-binding protein [Pseudomonadota bacterium]
AADGRVLAAANLPEAKVLLVAIPNGFEAGQIVEQAREANPDIRIIARAHFDAEVDHLLEHGTDAVIMGEREIARAMLKHARGPELAGKLPSGDPPAGLPEDNTSADS